MNRRSRKCREELSTIKTIRDEAESKVDVVGEGRRKEKSSIQYVKPLILKYLFYSL